MSIIIDDAPEGEPIISAWIYTNDFVSWKWYVTADSWAFDTF
jgi:hypothetical protein